MKKKQKTKQNKTKKKDEANMYPAMMTKQTKSAKDS